MAAQRARRAVFVGQLLLRAWMANLNWNRLMELRMHHPMCVHGCVL